MSIIQSMKRYAPATRRIFLLALREANRLGDVQIQPEHILLGLASAQGNIKQELERHGLGLEQLRRQFQTLSPAPVRGDVPLYSSACRALVAEAFALAETLPLEPRHLLLALLQYEQGKVHDVLKANLDLSHLRLALKH